MFVAHLSFSEHRLFEEQLVSSFLCSSTAVTDLVFLPVCVYVRGIRRDPTNGYDDVQQLEFHRQRYYYIPTVEHEAFNRC